MLIECSRSGQAEVDYPIEEASKGRHKERGGGETVCLSRQPPADDASGPKRIKTRRHRKISLEGANTLSVDVPIAFDSRWESGEDVPSSSEPSGTPASREPLHFAPSTPSGRGLLPAQHKEQEGLIDNVGVRSHKVQSSRPNSENLVKNSGGSHDTRN